MSNVDVDYEAAKEGSLESLRDMISTLDEQIIHLLSMRADLVEHIMRIKISREESPRDYERESAHSARLRRLARSKNVSVEFVDMLYSMITGQSIQIYRELRKDETMDELRELADDSSQNIENE